MSSYHHLRTLRTLAQGDPKRPLLVSPSGSRSAAELLGRAHRLAGWLRSGASGGISRLR